MTSETCAGARWAVCLDHLRDVSNDRAATMRWFLVIKNMCESGYYLDIFDLGVHIFDSFINSYFKSGENNENKTKEFFGLTGAASIILSAKLLDQKSDLSFASFPYYKQEALDNRERLILKTLQYSIDANQIPLSLARKMCSRLPDLSSEESKKFIEGVSEILAHFYVNHVQTTLFSTTTVALSAALMQFTRQKMNQSDTYHLFESIDGSKVNDCELCIRYMSTSLAPTKINEKSVHDNKSLIETSPVSVAKF